MRPSYIFISTYVIAISVVTIVGCNKDEVYDDCYENLEVTNHTSLTRSSSYDGFEVKQSGDRYAQNYTRNTQFFPHDNCCAVTALVYAWINKKGKSYFSQSNCPKTAQDYYDELIGNIVSNNERYDNWTTDSKTMDNSTFFKVVQDNPFNDSPLVSSYVDFAEQGITSASFFSNASNRQRVFAIELKNPVEGNHIAYVTSIKNTTIYFQGYDIFNPGLQRLSDKLTIKIGETKNGWYVIGVYLK